MHLSELLLMLQIQLTTSVFTILSAAQLLGHDGQFLIDVVDVYRRAKVNRCYEMLFIPSVSFSRKSSDQNFVEF